MSADENPFFRPCDCLRRPVLFVCGEGTAVMPFFPCLASGRCLAGRFRVLRLLPMGRNLRVEPFCFARKEVSPMVMLFCAFIPGILEFPESRFGSHVRRCANVTTDTAFAFRSGTDGSEGHRAIVRQSADFRTGCTPDGR